MAQHSAMYGCSLGRCPATFAVGNAVASLSCGTLTRSLLTGTPEIKEKRGNLIKTPLDKFLQKLKPEKLYSYSRLAHSSVQTTVTKSQAQVADPEAVGRSASTSYADEQDFVKAGGPDLDYVKLQAGKRMEQLSMESQLKPLVPGEVPLDLVVIGCGPAGLSLAAETAKHGLRVGLVGPDSPFVNNYGVWVDEFEAIGLDHCLDQVYRDTAIYVENDTPVLVGRAYGRVGRELLHDELLRRCAEAGVYYLNAEVDNIFDSYSTTSTVSCSNGYTIDCRLVTVAAGAASGKFLSYEESSQGVGVQTAYGMEIEVEGYPYDPSVMHYMDFRDLNRSQQERHLEEGKFESVPTFLYAMPVTSTRIFFEETCLAARPAMPFSMLKKRLERRLRKLGVTYTTVYEEEWSYVPVGGALPCTDQQHLGFGAAASMIHPATGYSITRSLTEAPQYAAAIAAALREGNEGAAKASPALAVAVQAWDSLWSRERKRQRAFMIFGLELIMLLDLRATREFFDTFFRLPEWMWKGFLATNLSSIDLLLFAGMTFLVAPNSLRYRLVRHLVTDPSGSNLVRTYLGLTPSKGKELPPASSAQIALLLLAVSKLAQGPHLHPL